MLSYRFVTILWFTNKHSDLGSLSFDGPDC